MCEIVKKEQNCSMRVVKKGFDYKFFKELTKKKRKPNKKQRNKKNKLFKTINSIYVRVISWKSDLDDGPVHSFDDFFILNSRFCQKQKTTATPLEQPLKTFEMISPNRTLIITAKNSSNSFFSKTKKKSIMILFHFQSIFSWYYWYYQTSVHHPW